MENLEKNLENFFFGKISGTFFNENYEEIPGGISGELLKKLTGKSNEHF